MKRIITGDRDIVPLFFILLISAGLRIYKLAVNSLWTDEAIFLLYRKGSLLESLKYTWIKLFQGELGPGNHGYSIFSLLMSSLVKDEFMLRLSSVIAGIISVVLIYYLGKELFGRRAGLISAFILAISPFHIYYSQEFRMYTFISFFTILTVIFLKRFTQSGKRRFLLGYVISHTLNIYFHFTTVLILLAETIFFLFYRKKYSHLLKAWLIGLLIIILLCIPEALFLIMYLRHHRWMESFIIAVSTVSELGFISIKAPFFTLKNFLIGYNASLSIYLFPALLSSVLVIWGIIKTKKKEELNLCLCCLFIPMAIMYVAQRFLYADRYLIPSSIFLYLSLSNGIAFLKRSLVILTLILVSAFYFCAINNYYRGYLQGEHEQHIAVHTKKEHRQASDYIVTNFQKGDVVFHVNPNTVLPFEYYLKFKDNNKKTSILNNEQIGSVLRFSKDAKELSALDYLTNRRLIDRAGLISVRGHKRVWLVFSAREFEEANKPGSYERRIVEWMDKHYIRNNVKEFKGIILISYNSPG
ncbi:MAG: glycosyltransferase family 39 protein [Candidatus Omnitrophota bacterium]